MISVILPVYNEARALPATLDALLAQQGLFETIVVDGGSEDATCEIVRRYARVRLIASGKGRGAQMNAGARVARGSLLLFLHADTLLPEGAMATLERIERTHAAAGGAFRHRFSGHDWRLRAVSWVNNQRCRRTRIFYGDQAIFVRADLFQRIGGFPEQPILEDILFSERLRLATCPLLLDEYVVTDARKFLAVGITRATLRALAILLRHQLGMPIAAGAFFDNVR